MQIGIGEVIQIVGRSLYVTVTATLIAMFFGIILSIFIYLKDFKLKKQLMLVVNALMSTPPVVMGLVVFLMLSKKGPLGSFELLFTCPAMIIAQVLLLIPMSISLIVDALNKCGEDILITCKILQVEKIKQKYANVPQVAQQKMQEKQMEIYKKNNYNIVGSCVVMLLNMVVTVAVFLTLFNYTL